MRRYFTRSTIRGLVWALGFLALAAGAYAQTTVEYDAAGNEILQSNVVTAGLPVFQELGAEYVGANSNGFLSLSVPVTGSGPFSWQWLFNGVPIAGATNDSLLLLNSSGANIGKYQLVARNSAGAVTSSVVNVSFFDPDGSGLPVAWEIAYFGTTGIDPNADPDGDGVNNYQEFLDGTDPANPNSVMPRLYVSVNGPGTVAISPSQPKYQLGEVVQLTAQPQAGALFESWLGTNAAPVPGDFTNSGITLNVVMNSTKWITAQFTSPVVAWGLDDEGQTQVPAGLQNVTAVAGGQYFSLALKNNGTVAAWGDNAEGETNLPPNLTNVMAISGGAYFGLALQSNGMVVAWGGDGYGGSLVPAGLSNVAAVAAGGYFGEALQSNGTVVAWGSDGSGQTNVPAGLSNVVAIAAGDDFGLALQNNGTIIGWGDNDYGQITIPAGISNVVAIAAGDDFSMALLANGTVQAWGDNSSGQINVPAGLSNVVAISAGYDFGLALQNDGTVAGWGESYYGATPPPAGLNDVTSMAAGGFHGLALANDGAAVVARQPLGGSAFSGSTAILSVGALGAPPLSYQWMFNGSTLKGATNANLTLTNATAAASGVYSVEVSNSLGAVQSADATFSVNNSGPIILAQPPSRVVHLGGSAVFSVGVAGSMPISYQWQFQGANIQGATQATLALSNVTAAQFGNYSVKLSNAYGAETSATAPLEQTFTSVAAWGSDYYGETNVPFGLGNITAIAAESYSSLALENGGVVAAWGYNSSGETNVPPGLSNVVAIAGGGYFGLAVQSNGTVAGWGDNSYSELQPPAGLSNVLAVAAGFYHSLALLSNGTVVAWGDNEEGQATPPAGLTNVVAIAAGAYFSVALLESGAAVGWGDNSYNQISFLTGLSNAVGIAAGSYHTLALLNNGTVAAGGYNGYGQTSVPAGLSNVVTIAAGNYSSLALQVDGALVGWGNSSGGQLTVPAGVSNIVAIAAGNEQTLAILNNGAPFLSRQSPGVSGYTGGTTVLSVGAAGASSLNYQWRLNGLKVQGATNSVLTLSNEQTGASGIYTLVISNSFGAVTSADMTVSVSQSSPIILSQPGNQTVETGETAVFSVNATGSLPLTYHWQFDGQNISGATQTTLTLTNVTAAEAGNYRVAVSNSFGGLYSSNAILTRALSLVAAWGDNEDGQTNVPAGLSDVLALAGEDYASLALTASGTVVGWGDDQYGETNVPPNLTNVVAIAGGAYFGLALLEDGKVVGWGNNSYGETNPPADVSNVVAIAAGAYSGLALQSNGTVMGWGYNYGNFLSPPAGASNVVSIAAGAYHALALTSAGTVLAWGDNSYGQTNVPAGLSNVVAVAGGFYDSVALLVNGTVVCWGDDDEGETNVPPGLTNVVAIAAHDYFNLALLGDGQVVGWGENSYGQTDVPASISNVVAIGAGAEHALAVYNNGSPYISRQIAVRSADSGSTVVLSAGIVSPQALSYQWMLDGTNLIGATNASLVLSNAQVSNSGAYSVSASNALGVVHTGNAALTVKNVAPVILEQPATQAVLLGHSAVFAAAAAGSSPIFYQWQLNGANLAGATQNTLSLASVIASELGSYRIRASNAFGSVFSSNATLGEAVTTVVAWGDSYEGQTNVPPGLTNVTDISGGGFFSMALQNGLVTAWGDNSYGESNVAASLSNVVAISGGYEFGLALQSNGAVVAWGDNSYGQTTTPSGLTNVAAIAAGYEHCLALQSNGTVVAWGDNGYGEIATPPGLSNVMAIAAGAYHSVALLSNGTVMAWGYHQDGETNVPEGLSNVVAIAAGGYHNLALQAGGTVVAWGYDYYGQTNIPTGLSNVVRVAAGDYFSLALQNNGQLASWGDNSYGQLNVPANLSNIVNIAAGDYHTLVEINDGAPVIAQSSTGELADSGATVVLTAEALGAPPLSYQWLLNGVRLAGATNGQLILSNAQKSASGVYSVIVSNLYGTAAGPGQTVQVSNFPPAILIQPASENVLLGAGASFSVTADGSLPMTYQWQLNEQNISGATNPALILSNVTTTNLGSYRVTVNNAFGSVVSSNALLPDATSLVMAWGDDSDGQTNVPPLTTTIAVAGDGFASLALEASGALVPWGDDSYGETTVPAGLTNVAAVAGGAYHNLALESNGTVAAWGDNYDGQAVVPSGLTNVMAVAAGFVHSLALQSNGTVVAWGGDDNGQTTAPANLGNVSAIAAGGYFSLALQNSGTVAAWGDNSDGQTSVSLGLSNVMAIAAGDYFAMALQQNGKVVAWGDNSYGETNAPSSLSNVVAIAAGDYFAMALQQNGKVVVWGDNSYGETQVPASLSNAVAVAGGGYHALALFNNGSPFISTQPVNVFAYNGATTALSVGAAGLAPLKYQWKFNGANIAGATNAILTLTNAKPAEAGLYSVAVANSLGTVASAGATLAVSNAVPVILVQPATQPAALGGNVTYSVTATGAWPILGYQWQFDSASIAGATNSALTVSNIAMGNVGSYRVDITNTFGTTVSSNALLEIRPLNDMFSNRLAIAGASNTVTGSNNFATKEPGEPAIAGNPGGGSVWWTWTAPTNGPVTVSTVGSSFDTILGVYTGGAVANLKLVTSGDDDGTSLASLVTFWGLAGTNYQIAVDGFDGAVGNITLTVSQSPPGAPFIVTPLQNQIVDIGGCVTFSVQVGGEGPFVYQWRDNGSAVAGATQSALTMDVLSSTAAGTYSVVVSNAYGKASSAATLTLVAGPPNDAFADAIALGPSLQSATGSNNFATKEPGEPDHGGNIGGSSVWWTWTAPSNELVMLDTTGSSFPTLLGVYTGVSISNLTLIANDNGLNGYRSYFGSYVAFDATAGTRYEIAVDGYNGATGDIALNLQVSNTVVPINSNNLVISSGKLLGNHQFQLYLTDGVLGQSYALLASSDLAHWQPVLDFVFTNSPTVIIDPSAAGFKDRFYKIGPLSAGSGGTLQLPPAHPFLTTAVTLTFIAPPGSYNVQVSPNLVHWLTLTNIVITNSPFQFIDTSGARTRFYRLATP